MTEGLVRLQPLSIIFDEGLIVSLLRDTLPLLLIKKMQILDLQLDDFHIIKSRKSIQFLPFLLEGSEFLLVRKRQLSKVSIYGMQGMNTYCIIRIAVCLFAFLHSVIDRKELNGMHSCRCNPIGNLFEVAKVPYSLTAFRAKREERHNKSSHFPM